MGESAGGNLAASVAQRARDAGISLAGQVLVYPATDPEASNESRREFFDGPFLSVEAIDGMWGAYLQGAPVDTTVAPLRAADLSGLPPALVISMELDPARDEAEDYAERLKASGVEVQLHRLPGLIHGAFNMDATVPAAKQIYELTKKFAAKNLRPAARV
jgi:acetyl esterase/lipase